MNAVYWRDFGIGIGRDAEKLTPMENIEFSSVEKFREND